ncbi:MAG: chloride channel protein [Lachnospiraceae bacterium]|nr:chloride channel protein [Lachnospiraceae bacterium]
MKNLFQNDMRDSLQESQQQLKSFAKWIVFSIIAGFVVGSIGTIFHFCLSWVTKLRGNNPWIVCFLPIGGLLIVGGYHLLHNEKDSGTNLVISSIHSGDELPLRMAPSIFFSTLVTHMLGGSAGREGAALQLGGSIGNAIGKVFRFDEKDRHIMTMCGMSAAFSALFGTPMAAAVFSMEVVSVGVMYYAALVPCVIAALVAHAIAAYFGAEAEIFLLQSLPEFTVGSAVKVSVLAVLCAFVSVLFCILLHQAAHLYQKFFVNPYIRIFVGGCIVVVLTFLVGDQTYNGSGIDLVGHCMNGEVRPEMFLLKMLFTAATLGAGYKGGEIVPSFCIGGTFGCLFGVLTGFSPSLCTAVGMAAVFCGVTNSPITSLLISFELFGYAGMPYFLLAVSLSYMMSGYHGLYHTQKIMYSKFKTDFINKKVS